MSLLLTAAMPMPAAAQLPGLQANSGRDCATCHLNWIETFRQPTAVLLMDLPDHAVVADSDTCLGCHDGAVGDSRRRVWVEHGHRTGVKPTEAMKVPPQLPLNNGEIACRTCHTAHSGQGPETLATAVFLRMRNDASQLCISCHEDKTKGPELGTHPVGGMPWPVPQELIAAGAHQGPDTQRLICQTCHTPHGSSRDDLLVMGTESSQLCLTCHTKVRPGFWRPDMGREHPQNPPLSSDAQRAAIHEMGTKTGPGETLICLSCHKLHHGQAGRYMLADTLHNSDLCLRCHPGRKEMFGTQHDLRASAPAELNRLGQTPEQSGPCGACHSFHQFARRPEPQTLDPTGLCATCHQPGQCAGKKSGLPFSHPTDIQQGDITGKLKLQLYGSRDGSIEPGLACLTCHNPHETSQRHFLRSQPAEICASCHVAKAAAMKPQHDFTDRPELTNARGETAAQAGACGFCHGVHNAVGQALWVATKNQPQMPNGWCTECHSPEGMAKAVQVPALRHPTGLDARALAKQISGRPDAPVATLPLFDEKGRRSPEGVMGCASCHDPHGGLSSFDDMIRPAHGSSEGGLCMQCHREAESLRASLHGDHHMGQHFEDTRYCLPCHAAHEMPGMTLTGMWVAPLGPAEQSPAIRQCTGCHSRTGKATPIIPTPHPILPMHNVVEEGRPGYMPLFDENGKPGASGGIACGTCHVPHGPEPGSRAHAAAGETQPENLRGLRSMVRPFTMPNVCSTCHGFDALRRYLYYHDPQRRGGTSGAQDERRP